MLGIHLWEWPALMKKHEHGIEVACWENIEASEHCGLVCKGSELQPLHRMSDTLLNLLTMLAQSSHICPHGQGGSTHVTSIG